jgi:iron-sulfur cluster repair protein YtfE (RIC family)
MTKLALETRTGLPDALRVLVDDLPRAAWAQHPDFYGLVSFWLDRHLMFRKLMDHMAVETEAMLDKRRDPVAFAQGVARHGGMFVEQLHGHHQIEDQHYFPLLAQRDARIVAGFDLLDADHHALDGHIARFVEGANGAISGAQGADPLVAAEGFRAGLAAMQRLLDRHLVDEEELIVPVILTYGVQGLS